MATDSATSRAYRRGSMQTLTPNQRREVSALMLLERGAVRLKSWSRRWSPEVVAEVVSQTTGEVYDVTREGGEWLCGCAGFLYHEADPKFRCKHIRAVQIVCRALRGSETDGDHGN